MARHTRTGGREATDAIVAGQAVLSIGRSALPTPDRFRWVPLSQLARLESGHTPSRSRPEYWEGGTIPWIGIKDATANHGQRIIDTNQHVTPLGIDNSSARILPADTVCLSRTASVGFVVIMGRPMATSQDFVNWVCGPDLSPSYLRYLLMFEQESIRRFAYGTTHQTLYFPDAKALQICIPLRREQDAIAEVLGALDDKIAASIHVIRTSSDLLKATFLRTAAELEFGPLSIQDVATVGGGGTPSTKEQSYWNGGVPWATPTDVTALDAPYLWSTSRTISESGLAACSSPFYPRGSILMTSRATIGAFAITQVPTAVNQGFIVVRAVRPEHQWWLFHEMQSRVPEFISHANGATFLELSRGKFKALPVRVPSDAAAAQFQRSADAVHSAATAADKECRQLAELRDTLLPHLMSGRLRVKDAEKQVEDVV